MTQAQMYWIVTLDSIHASMTAMLAISLMVGVFMTIPAIADGSRKCGIVAIVSCAISLLSFALITLTPTAKEMAAMIVIPKIVNGEKVATEGNKLYDLAMEWEARDRREDDK